MALPLFGPVLPDTWDDSTELTERLALLAALIAGGSKLGPERYQYDRERTRWERIGPFNEDEKGPVVVVVGSEASVQLSRLYKLGIGYHAAMGLAGYGKLEVFSESSPEAGTMVVSVCQTEEKGHTDVSETPL